MHHSDGRLNIALDWRT